MNTLKVIFLQVSCLEEQRPKAALFTQTVRRKALSEVGCVDVNKTLITVR